MKPLSKRAGQVVLLLCTIVLFVACSAYEVRSVEEAWVRHDHQSGLSLCLPHSLTVESSANGFSVYPKGTKHQYRVPLEVTVSLQAGETKAQANWIQSWPLFNNVKYRIDEEEGGSGGTGYRLTAWQSNGDGYIVYQQYTQADGTKPDFSFAWQVINASGLDNPCVQPQL